MDTVSISVVEPAQVVTINVTTGFGNVTNSDGSYNDTVNVGQTLVVPDSNITNTDNTYVFPLPATQPHIVPDSIVSNSDDSWQVSNPAAQPLEVPNSTITNTAGATLISLPATKPYQVQDSIIMGNAGLILKYLPAEQNYFVPNSLIKNTLGTTLGSVQATQTFTVPNAWISNSDDSYVVSQPAGVNHEIPDTTIKNTAGTTILTQPSATSTGVIADSVVSNSDDSYIQNVPAETNLELPDVTHIDTDETAVIYPSAKPFTCTPPVYKWYGIEYDVTATSPDVTRINSFGDDDLHYTLPIQSGMRACLLTDAGAINYWLDPNDWTKKIDGTASNLSGTDGQVMIYVPRHYRKFETSGNIYRCKLSMYPISGFHAVPAFYYGAYEASLYRPTLKLSSVVNATADYRGGNNNAAWDAQANTLLGKPATQINRTNFRTYARNRAAGTNWNINTYEQHKTITWLFVVEYATRWSQKPVDNTFTAEGYRKGGLGNGVSTANSTEWTNFNSQYPFINCGASNILATKSGEVSVSVTDFGGVGVPRSFTVNRYRGIEMPFGHIYKNLDGVNIDVKTVAQGDYSRMYVTNNPADFNDANYTNYSDMGLIARANGYIKTLLDGAYGEIAPNVGGTVGGGSTTFWSDYYYTNIASSSLRTIFVGGSAPDVVSAGIVYLISNYTPTSIYTTTGSRLCYIP